MNIEFLVDLKHIRKLYEKMSDIVCHKYAITHMEMDIIAFLYNNPKYDTAKEIVEIRMLTKSHVSSSVDRLYSAGLIAKEFDIQDKRVIHLSLTDKSKPLCMEISDMQKSYFDALHQNMSDNEFNELYRLISKVTGNAEAALEEL